MTQATSPVKLFEYMAAGRPIVTTDMPECRNCDCVRIARNAAEFMAMLDNALICGRSDGHGKLDSTRRPDQNTWEANIEQISPGWRSGRCRTAGSRHDVPSPSGRGLGVSGRRRRHYRHHPAPLAKGNGTVPSRTAEVADHGRARSAIAWSALLDFLRRVRYWLFYAPAALRQRARELIFGKSSGGTGAPAGGVPVGVAGPADAMGHRAVGSRDGPTAAEIMANTGRRRTS